MAHVSKKEPNCKYKITYYEKAQNLVIADINGNVILGQVGVIMNVHEFMGTIASADCGFVLDSKYNSIKQVDGEFVIECTNGVVFDGIKKMVIEQQPEDVTRVTITIPISETNILTKPL